MKKQMTHNEYMEYMKANANRLYTEKGYTMADYNRDCDSVEVLDYDLSRFGLSFSEEQLRVVNSYFTEENVSRLGNTMLRGHVMREGAHHLLANTLGMDVVVDRFYNGFFKNDADRCLLGFCEGDITLTLCETAEAYKQELASSVEFYREAYGIEVNVKILEEDDIPLEERLEDAVQRSGSVEKGTAGERDYGME